MTIEPAYVATIVDAKDNLLTFDLLDILRTLRNHFVDCQWCITEFDAVGPDSAVDCKAVEESGDGGFWLPNEAFVALAERTVQTIDGTFFGFDHNQSISAIDRQDLDLFEFSNSSAIIAITAIDSTLFEVYYKDNRVLHSLENRFQNVSVRIL